MSLPEKDHAHWAEVILQHKSRAFVDAAKERARQVHKWGIQKHDVGTFLEILTEEVGECAQASLHDKFGGDHKGTLRKEMVQVAAVALQIVQHLDAERYEEDFESYLDRKVRPYLVSK